MTASDLPGNSNPSLDADIAAVIAESAPMPTCPTIRQQQAVAPVERREDKPALVDWRAQALEFMRVFKTGDEIAYIEDTNTFVPNPMLALTTSRYRAAENANYRWQGWCGALVGSVR
jgi:hypothetical protein